MAGVGAIAKGCCGEEYGRGCGEGQFAREIASSTTAKTHGLLALTAMQAPLPRQLTARRASLQPCTEAFTVCSPPLSCQLAVLILCASVADQRSFHNGTTPLHHRLRPQEVRRGFCERHQGRPMGTIVRLCTGLLVRCALLTLRQ